MIDVFLLRSTGAANDPNQHGKGFDFDFAVKVLAFIYIYLGGKYLS